MKKIPFEIEINIVQVPTRNCRFYQEQIYDFYADGRARYEWDRIRQNFILRQDSSMEEICETCHLNLLLDVEGCKGELYEFETFLRALPNIKPDSIILKKHILNAMFNEEETGQLIKEMEDLQNLGDKALWPVAQVFYNNKPVVSEDSQRPLGMVFQEWSGDNEIIFYTSNEGYHIGLTSEGIILKKAFGETFEEPFISLQKKGFRIVGETVSGKRIPIPINRGVLPDWFPEMPDEDTELRFNQLPIKYIFDDIFNMIIVFGQTALENFTGVNIFSQFYRRA